jgi:hypothetical protein
LRAAADELELHTSLSPREQADFTSIVDAYGSFSTTVHERGVPVVFDYFTPLSPPAVSGLGTMAPAVYAPAARTVLWFGMVEAGQEVAVDAETLVVDPQGDSAEISLKGSKFGRLAIVANERETIRLGGRENLTDAAAQLRESTGADVVVAKCGARGALVAQEDGIDTVGSWPTNYVFPIGSGDVFAAAFAMAYGERQQTPMEAARYASRSAAHWCASPSEPALTESYEPGSELPFADRPTVYIAAPFFGLGQCWLVDLVRRALMELGAEPFSPLHDVGRGGPEVATADLDGLKRSASVLALLDDFDPGTLIEVGYAIHRNLPVVAYLDPRPTQHMVMIEGSGVDVATDLSSAVYRSIWRGMAAQAH